MSSQMLIFPGPEALSSFRIATLITAVNKLVNSSVVTSIKSCYVHYVDVDPSLLTDSSSLDKLHLLLKYDNALDLSDPLTKELFDLVQVQADTEGLLTSRLGPDTYLIRVIPRSGTISPWSSKATNIVEVCGLGNLVHRVERGQAFLLQVRPGFPILDFFNKDKFKCLSSVYDRMTQTLYVNESTPKFDDLFASHNPKPLVIVDILGSKDKLYKANKAMGLALDEDEVQYLIKAFHDTLHRNPTDVELFMFAQVNSEHCRHKIFNADWKIDGDKMDRSLFQMIRNTHKLNPQYTVSAYSDNAAVYEGTDAYLWYPDVSKAHKWTSLAELVHTLIKVETHNHPTAVSPFPGAATGSGGEIRDEAAVGRGSKTRCGLAGYIVSDLQLPGQSEPWELNIGRPDHIASPLEIMIEAPLGSAAFNNEFGRPAITGFFRTLTTTVKDFDGKPQVRGFHKPIMLAGGLGSVRPQLSLKSDFKVTPGACLIALGGPSMLIGLGGGAASSVASGEGSAELDFASVQRGNPEMQRRAQQVIDACNALGMDSPIQCIHDVGAGGLSNAFPELVHDNGLGGKFELRNIPCLEPGMSPMELWCNESQERYVLAVAPHDIDQFKAVCNRERCPFAVVGTATSEQRLILTDKLLNTTPIDLDMSLLFGKPPRMSREDATRPLKLEPLKLDDISVADALGRVLHLPCVGSKSFLITIGDRTVTGLIDRDQFVGPWQVPVADVGVAATSLGDTVVTTGDAMATGERPALALISPESSARICVAESLTNLFAADLRGLDRVKLSANWMSSASTPGEGSALYRAVKAVGMEMCPALGIEIPVGKDSMSMKMSWDKNEVVSPLALCITAFCGVNNTSKTWTPVMKREDDTVLVLVDLGNSSHALGASALSQVFRQVGNDAPDVHDVQIFKGFLEALLELHQGSTILAYHDRSDGGLIVTLLEMAFASRSGLDIELKQDGVDVLAALFNEEVGSVFQVKRSELDEFATVFEHHGVPKEAISIVGKPVFSSDQKITISVNGVAQLAETRAHLQQQWASTSHFIQRLRDNPQSADQEYQSILDNVDPGLTYKLTYDPVDDLGISTFGGEKPKVAILREQGVNSQLEMAWCFQQAGFNAYDVHMTDIISGKVSLNEFVGIAACGGFSYGDVLGAGNGWAKSVLYNSRAKAEFRRFFHDRADTFAFGSCNGCQFLTRLKELIPGAESWPTFEKNKSEQYEARVCTLEVTEENSAHPCIFFDGMRGSKLPIAVAHGEGRASFESERQIADFDSQGLVAARYVDNYGVPTEKYPFNPNGSPEGISGVRTPNGRVLAMMPHPERVSRLEANSYYPEEEIQKWGGYGPWIRLFRNARVWVEKTSS
ncbi:phosphoribosylformylglycinamidine synthase [Brettanomyces nanus]|uniref:Phosphoribosylformylglycinamidine synthase n=1 Tax=Eeniella nana TaxID=13502 RepID=A0A875RQI5_EENNA|nr:phosphoribosylformylglycinamidine synthase [Brettanomyces nanus]QPG77080.1 phosphoribosylformylglycinamidine synthase [Brettanomyces nanus]